MLVLEHYIDPQKRGPVLSNTGPFRAPVFCIQCMRGSEGFSGGIGLMVTSGSGLDLAPGLHIS